MLVDKGDVANLSLCTPGSVGGTVPATLSLTLGAPASFGAFTPGIGKDYSAQTSANVISTAGDATLTRGRSRRAPRPGTWSTARSRCRRRCKAGGGGTAADVGGSSAPTVLKTWANPVSNDPVTIAFFQHIDATDALRTGAYSQDADVHAVDDDAVSRSGGAALRRGAAQ